MYKTAGRYARGRGSCLIASAETVGISSELSVYDGRRNGRG